MANDESLPDRDAVQRGPQCDESVVVVINGDSRSIPAGSTAHDLVVLLGLVGRPLAVEINQRVVPRARLADCRLSAGDRLEFVTLVGGG